MTKRQVIAVRHRATREAAIARRSTRGLILVQFNNLDHPHAYGWHLYPRHQFERRKS